MFKQKFFWVAILDDDSAMLEFTPDGQENMYRDIPRDKVKLFGLQSANSSYFIDLEDGRFNIRDYRNDKSIDIKIPISGQLLNVGGKLGSLQRYQYYQWKRGYQDFENLVSRGNVIEEHIIGYKRMMSIQGYGSMLVDVSLSLDPRIENVSPKITVAIKVNENSKSVAGSPYVINL